MNKLLLLLVLSLSGGLLSECLTPPNGDWPFSTSTGRRADAGHPALLDAIRNFSSAVPPLPDDARRVFHGRGGLHPGADHLTLDYYPPVFLLTAFEPLPDEELNAYGDALEEAWDDRVAGRTPAGAGRFAAIAGNEDAAPDAAPEAVPQTVPLTWVYQCRTGGGRPANRIMRGAVPEPHVVTQGEGRDRYLVHLARGQNHGLFLDMSAGRAWLRDKCASGEVSTVLNLFAYTCAFSVTALNGGAVKVVNVDMSRGALRIGQRNHELNGLGTAGGASFLPHDLFKSWGRLRRDGPYDCVVVDPPSYQKGSFVASKDYIKVIRRLPSLLDARGWALLCLNAPELDCGFLMRCVEEGAPELRFVERLENPREFAAAFPERALKVLAFRCIPPDE